MKLRDLSSLGHEWEGILNASHDLWSWLPSHASAERALGDYWQEFCPEPADIMKEASMVHRVLADYQENFLRVFTDTPYKVEVTATGSSPERIRLDKDHALTWFSVYNDLLHNCPDTKGLTEEGELAHIKAYFASLGVPVTITDEEDE